MYKSFSLEIKQIDRKIINFKNFDHKPKCWWPDNHQDEYNSYRSRICVYHILWKSIQKHMKYLTNKPQIWTKVLEGSQTDIAIHRARSD